MWPTGLAVPRHVGSSKTRNQTCVFYIGRQIVNHWTTREAQSPHFTSVAVKMIVSTENIQQVCINKKILLIKNAREGVEKWEPSYTAGGNVSW